MVRIPGSVRASVVAVIVMAVALACLAQAF